MRANLVAVALAVVGCGGTEAHGLPPVEALYSIGASVDCRETVDEQWVPSPSAALRHSCTWENVTVAGAPTCAVTLVFARVDAFSPWALESTFILDCP